MFFSLCWVLAFSEVSQFQCFLFSPPGVEQEAVLSLLRSSRSASHSTSLAPLMMKESPFLHCHCHKITFFTEDQSSFFHHSERFINLKKKISQILNKENTPLGAARRKIRKTYFSCSEHQHHFKCY